jgi:hypothetical protein
MIKSYNEEILKQEDIIVERIVWGVEIHTNDYTVIKDL